MDTQQKVYLAGHRGLAGSAIHRALVANGFTDIVTATSTELDLRDRVAVDAFFDRTRPDLVIDAAAKVGGILANDTYTADFLSDNLLMQVNLFDAANRTDVDRLLFLGSSCIYPRAAAQPIHESALMTGPLEPTNEGYAVAKIAGLAHVQASRKQFGRHWIAAMPTNLYGPGDNFHPDHSHVLAALVRRIHEAKVTGADSVIVWGTGTPRREFLHVDDMADAMLFLLEHYDDGAPINVGVGEDIAIRELAELIATVIGYEGTIESDLTKPDGMPRKLLDVTRLSDLGWTARTPLEQGIAETYQWYLEHAADVRVNAR